MRVLISAAEVSADHHGAQLLSALRRVSPAGEVVEAFGLGGARMRAEGLDALVDSEGLRAMGTSEVLGKLPAYRRALARLVLAAAERKPDLLLCLDSPDFQMRLARKLPSRLVKVYYIPPKVWIWRRKRVYEIRRLFERVLCIFPFEVTAFQEASNPAEKPLAVYVGNPLLDELPLQETRQSARAQLGLGHEEKVLVVMPGSRPGELSRHLPLIRDSVQRFVAQAGGEWKILVPLSNEEDRVYAQSRLEGWSVRWSVGDAHLCLKAADLGLVKSGTGTLEAALLGCPHILFYKPSWITGFLFQRVVGHRKAVGLVNWIAGRQAGNFLVPEFVTSEATPERLAGGLLKLWTQDRAPMLSGFLQVARELSVDESPSRRAAREIWELYLGNRRSREGGEQ